MKKCTSCAKDLPDTAMHCVFCGAKQAAPAAQGPNPNAKTVLGYSAADLLKQAGIQQPAPGGGFPPPAQQPQGFPPPPAQQPQFPPPGGGGFGGPPPQQFQPPQPAPYQPPQQFQPPQPAPYQPPQPAPYQPPQPQFQAPPPAQGGQFGGSATAATMFMQNAPPIPQQPPQQMPAPYQAPPQQMGGMPAGMPAPAPFQPPQQPMGGGMGMGGMPGANPYPPPGGGQPMGMPGGNPYAAPGGNPYAAPGQPPFLASQTAARENKPIEPFNDITKIVLLAFGGCLLALFVVPLSLSPLMMAVTTIGDLPGAAKLGPILVGAAGVLAIVLALTPMQTMQRALFASAIGLVPILMFATFVMGGFDWHMLLFPLGGVLVPTGLLLRDKYPSDSLPRMFIFAGAACVLVPYFVPFQMTALVENLLKSIIHPALLMDVLAMFVPAVLAVLAVLLALIPGQTKFGAKQLAWGWFLVPPALWLAHMGLDGSIVKVLTHGPGQLFAWAGPPGMGAAAATATAMKAAASSSDANAAIAAAGQAVQATATLPLFTGFAAIATFGLATLFGKQLEMSK